MSAPGQRTPTLAEVTSATRQLAHLVDTACDALYDRSPGWTGPEADRVDALFWIARDLAEKLADDVAGVDQVAE